MSRVLWLADVLADTFRGVAGVRVTAMSGWESRGRAALYPRGVMNHHTGGGSASFANQKSYITHGSSISPLANWMTSRPINGVVEVAVIAAGKANHAGRGYLSWTGTDRGNNYTIGGEHQNDGSQAWPGQQVEVIRMGSAALLTKIGQDVDRLVDHKTYAPRRKVDRHSTSVENERRIVAQIMKGGHTPTPVPPPSQEDDMLAKGSKGDAVALFQKALLRFGANIKSDPWPAMRGYGADGDFGGTTEAAVEDYQRSADLPVTGRIDGVTASLLIRYVVSGGGGGKHRHAVTADPRLTVDGKTSLGNELAKHLVVNGILHTSEAG